MAKKSFNKVNGLQLEITRRANKALNNEVADYVKGKLKEHVYDDIYSSYIPVIYERRGEERGLMDEKNMPHKVRNKTLSVYEHATVDPPRLPYYQEYNNIDGLARLLEEGPYDAWHSVHADEWAKPRPFMTKTQKEINRHNGEIVEMLKDRIEHDDNAK